jgi:hypothetical protein
MNMELTECSETSVHKIQTPGNHPDKEYNEVTVLQQNEKTMLQEKQYLVVQSPATEPSPQPVH